MDGGLRLGSPAHYYSTLLAAPDIRNVAIIAHVDHGKTTLIDRLLSDGNTAASSIHSPASNEKPMERVMDSGVFERERGITISAKYTSFVFDGTTFNIVDTPGHADFGGEVERALGLVDGALLVVDACEGPMSQTKYVLGKALGKGIRPLVLLNKVDRPGATAARCGECESDIFDVCAGLGATEEQLDFATLYASAREGWASEQLPSGATALAEARAQGMAPLLRALQQHVPPPAVSTDAPFAMLVAMTERDSFLGRIATGRIAAGSVRLGDRLRVVSHIDGEVYDGSKVTKIFKRIGGAGTIDLKAAFAGDLVSIAGASHAGVNDSIVSLDIGVGLPPEVVDPPTLSMVFSANTSPLAGKEGSSLTAAKIGERLAAEAEVDVALRIRLAEGSGGESWEVQARGELQLGLLMENMRREGFEISVSPPKVILRSGEQGERLEPIEELVCEVEDAHAGDIIEVVTLRKGLIMEAGPAEGAGAGRQRLVFHAPARGLIGFRSLFAYLTRGSGVLHRAFSRWDTYCGSMDAGRKGSLVATTQGRATLHALGSLEARGILFIKPGDEVYEGMIVGESSRGGDLEVNPCKEKQLTNVRNTGSEDKVFLSPPRVMTLEEAIGYVASDELIEVTPKSVRLRKKTLESSRRRAERRKNET